MATTRVLHRLCRAAAGRSRSEPVRSVRKCLLQLVIQGRSRPYRVSLYRSVTPEVAGSSPVAPVKISANRQVLSVQTPGRGRPHRPSPETTRSDPRRASGTFKRIEAEFRPPTNWRAANTKRPEI